MALKNLSRLLGIIYIVMLTKIEVNMEIMKLKSSLIDSILSVLRDFGAEELHLHEPDFRGNEWKYVKECIDTKWVSSSGVFVDRFENDLAEWTSHRRAVAVVNGTAALYMALKLVGVEREDEV